MRWAARCDGLIGDGVLTFPATQVQSGGSFDVDYSVEGPGSRVILAGEKERQGDFVFTAQHVGEYSFCFDNEMSTFTEKLVDFEISVRWLFALPAGATAG